MIKMWNENCPYRDYTMISPRCRVKIHNNFKNCYCGKCPLVDDLRVEDWK